MMNGLYISQQGQAYAIFTPQGEQIGLLFMGYDGQFAKDVVAINAITKMMARRWNIKPNKATN